MLIVHNDEKVDAIRKLIIEGSNLAVHGINSNKEDLSSVALTILNSDGLRTNKSSNFYYNCSVVGNEDNLEDALNYVYYKSNDSYVNLIIAVPPTITNINGEEYYMGNLPNSGKFLDKKHDRSYDDMLINLFIKNNGYIPREFIVGFVVGVNVEGYVHEVFIDNPYYIGRLDIEDRKAFGQSFIEECSIENDRLYNLTNLTIDDVENLLNVYKRFNMDVTYLEQLRNYLLSINSKKLN
mgnify:FL=1